MERVKLEPQLIGFKEIVGAYLEGLRCSRVAYLSGFSNNTLFRVVCILPKNIVRLVRSEL